MILSGLKSLLNNFLDLSVGLLDTVISWFFYLVPNDTLFGLNAVNDYIHIFFDKVESILLPLCPFLNIPLFLYFLFAVVILETTYTILRFIVWVLVKIIKP